MRNGDRVYGTQVAFESPRWAAALARVGLDFVFVDIEHVARDRNRVEWLCHHFRALGMAPIVRVPEPDPFQAAMVRDAGAQGVVFPYVESVDQAKALVGAVKYRPLKGRVLQDALAGRPLPGTTAEYLAQANRDAIAILNIESGVAMDALPQLASVPGVDAVFIGPHDLSINLGIPEQYRSPEFDRAVRQIIAVSREHSLGVGIHYDFGMDQEIEWSKAGANIVLHAHDITMAERKVRADFEHLREALGDTARERKPGQQDLPDTSETGASPAK